MNALSYGNLGYPYLNYCFPQNSSFPNYGGYNMAFQGLPWGVASSSNSSTDVSTSLSGQDAQSTSDAAASTAKTPKTKLCVSIGGLMDDTVITTDEDKNAVIVETTPEKAEEFKKKVKRDSTVRTTCGVTAMIVTSALAAWLGPKAAGKLAKHVRPSIERELTSIANGTALDRVFCGIIGCGVSLIPGMLYAQSKSTKKALVKEYFPEANIS